MACSTVLLVVSACSAPPLGSSDIPALTDISDAGSDVPDAGDEPGAGDKPDAGDAPDAGDEPDAGDAGWPEEGILLPTPEDIDCDDPAQSASNWCQNVCTQFAVDLGWEERVRFRQGSLGWAPSPMTCERSGEGGNMSVIWRAPYSGEWVVDNFGSESGWFRAVVDARCPESPLVCDWKRTTSVRLSLEEGQAIVVTSESNLFETTSPKVHQINITPLVAHESGADCLDGADNDADGLPDCLDPDCAQSPECTTPLCAHEILPSQVPLRVQGELTVEGHMNLYPGCFGQTTRERFFAWQAPYSGRFLVDASGTPFMESLSVHRNGCNGPQIAECRYSDPYASYYISTATAFDAEAGEWVYFQLGGINDPHTFGFPGDWLYNYELVIRLPEPETGEKCDDGIDNDGDGLVDYDDRDCAPF